MTRRRWSSSTASWFGRRTASSTKPTNSMLRKSGLSVDWKVRQKGLDTPSIREDSGNHNEDDECLNPQEVKQFRGLVARANYLAQDRPDIQFAKEVCRCMSKPTRRCWEKLKKDRPMSLGTSQSDHAIQ